MNFKTLPPLTCAALAIAPFATAQDSVAIGGPLPGDAVGPYITSEQGNRYTVDLQPLFSTWGTEFAIGPISKSSKTSSSFTTNLMAASGVSREIQVNVPLTGTWAELTVPGVGVNDDPGVNLAPVQVAATAATGVQLAAGFAEFGTTDGGAGFDGAIANIINYDPTNPTRLYVNRVNAATNGCSDTDELTNVAFGAINATGELLVRSDDFGTSGVGCAPGTTGNNLFYVNAATRDLTKVNALSGSIFTSGDFLSTFEPVSAATDTFSTPAIIDIAGVPYIAATNFSNEWVTKPAQLGGPFPGKLTHLAPGVTSTRGTMSVTEDAFPFLGATEGVGAMIGDMGSGTDTMNIFGIGAGGAVTGTLALTLPAVITDNLTGFTNLAGANEIDHYHSQVAFNGGNGQIAMNVDHLGNLLCAVVVDQPSDGGADWPVHYIAVARVSPTGTVAWTMAAYQDGVGGGKPYTDGAGTTLGNLAELGAVTGGAPLGPSTSSPMIDSYGNVYFFGASFDLGPSGFDTGLFRAVYDPATFSYELEQLFKVGRVLDSGLDAGGTKVPYQIQFVTLADSNSISSTAPFSQNISSDGHAGQTHFGVSGRDSLHLGGLVLSASITYDVDLDGDFDDDAVADPTTLDQNYQVQLFIGSPTACQLDLGVGQGPGDANLTVCGTGLGAGQSSLIKLTNVAPFTGVFAILSFPGQPNFPIGGGSLISAFGLVGGFPLGFNADANGEFNFTLGGSGVPNDFVLQFLAVDLLAPPNFLELSNAVLLSFG
ncbi:hypothetical protein [Engelhardtia mirabilis]|uniref:Uncharacterized protein n=1 Tax=Engelhardtia mirabilis TaxID=2528011 RepID=A0A518BIR4_9BACT|nr:hypothetical protein Pla133_19300 [Planctomycetes bacterium Pla133]QDV01180.1 hypothetical protein Pla86_19290 [Planctomycetes bacterium Pla86]